MITYKSTNTINGKFYIGSARDLAAYEKRKKSHLKDKLPYPFQRALQANPDAFEWEYTEDDAQDPVLEQSLLDMWFGKKQCYNLNRYADRPMPIPLEVARKVAEDNYRLKKGLWDPEYLQSEKYLGDRSRGGKNRVKRCRERGEDPVSKETRSAQLAATGKPVIVVFPDGTRVRCPSIQQAEKTSGCPAPCIARAMKEGRVISKGKAKGFRFEGA